MEAEKVPPPDKGINLLISDVSSKSKEYQAQKNRYKAAPQNNVYTPPVSY